MGVVMRSFREFLIEQEENPLILNNPSSEEITAAWKELARISNNKNSIADEIYDGLRTGRNFEVSVGRDDAADFYRNNFKGSPYGSRSIGVGELSLFCVLNAGDVLAEAGESFGLNKNGRSGQQHKNPNAKFDTDLIINGYMVDIKGDKTSSKLGSVQGPLYAALDNREIYTLDLGDRSSELGSVSRYIPVLWDLFSSINLSTDEIRDMGIEDEWNWVKSNSKASSAATTSQFNPFVMYILFTIAANFDVDSLQSEFISRLQSAFDGMRSTLRGLTESLLVEFGPGMGTEKQYLATLKPSMANLPAKYASIISDFDRSGAKRQLSIVKNMTSDQVKSAVANYFRQILQASLINKFFMNNGWLFKVSTDKIRGLALSADVFKEKLTDDVIVPSSWKPGARGHSIVISNENLQLTSTFWEKIGLTV